MSGTGRGRGLREAWNIVDPPAPRVGTQGFLVWLMANAQSAQRRPLAVPTLTLISAPRARTYPAHQTRTGTLYTGASLGETILRRCSRQMSEWLRESDLGTLDGEEGQSGRRWHKVSLWSAYMPLVSSKS